MAAATTAATTTAAAAAPSSSSSSSFSFPLGLTTLLLGDLKPNEDATRNAFIRYYADDRKQGDGNSDGHGYGHAWDWIPRTIRSKEEMEETMKLIQSKLEAADAESSKNSLTATDVVSSASLLPFGFPPPPPVPTLPPSIASIPPSSGVSISHRLRSLQSYLRSYEYNHLGAEFFPVDKNKSWAKVVSLAKDIQREALPIKCMKHQQYAIRAQS